MSSSGGSGHGKKYATKKYTPAPAPTPKKYGKKNGGSSSGNGGSSSGGAHDDEDEDDVSLKNDLELIFEFKHAPPPAALP
jgi:hypothetical protein